MISDFALDLKVARRKSGLRQCDAAHLVGICQTTLSKIEMGKITPSVRDVLTFSIIYNRSFENLLTALLHEAHAILPERLAALPECSPRWRSVVNRQATLNCLAAYLSDNTTDHEAA